MHAAIPFLAILFIVSSSNQKQSQPTAGVNTPARDDKRGTENFPLVVHNDSRPLDEGETNWDRQQADAERSQRTFENRLAALVAVTGLLQIGVLIGQWLLFRRQTNQMVTSERAWFVCRASFNWGRDDLGQVVAQIGFSYENVGKTPGFIKEIGFAVTGRETGKALPSVPPDYSGEDTLQWIPGLPIVPHDNMGRRATWTPTQPDIDACKRGELVIWVHGYVRYSDSFVRELRETRYCLRVVPHLDRRAEEFIIDGPPAYNSAS
jgi:hypothetical protein